MNAQPQLKYYSVLQDWVMQLTMRQQGVLCAAIRGPDGAPKEDPAKPIHRLLRGVVFNCARYKSPMNVCGEVLAKDSFMRTDYITDKAAWSAVVSQFSKEMDRYNTHYITHLLHAYAIVGYFHWDEATRNTFLLLYETCTGRMHFKAENATDISIRLRDGIRPDHDE